MRIRWCKCVLLFPRDRTETHPAPPPRVPSRHLQVVRVAGDKHGKLEDALEFFKARIGKVAGKHHQKNSAESNQASV